MPRKKILEPGRIDKFVEHLIIPPVMKTTGKANDYDISVRQFDQKILPGNMPPTTVWSYGPSSDPLPVGPGPDPASQFVYPACTIETIADEPVDVRWCNGLVDGNGNFQPHLLTVDQTVHWANPGNAECMDNPETVRTDCKTKIGVPYTGPVPICTHVHGAHVEPHSDGYPEAWWLPAANDIDASFTRYGQFFDDASGSNDGKQGYADYHYSNDQAATTLWYHDHTMGMTRLNVYAGPAGFWLIRGGAYDKPMTRQGRDGPLSPAVLPGPAPKAGDSLADLNSRDSLVRRQIREIPIVIQDRTFHEDGSLFYPEGREFFEMRDPEVKGLDIPFIPDPDSDISPFWNPEAFFNTIVVNGKTWPKFEVSPAQYRFRLLNGCNSRFIDLALLIQAPGQPELSFHQIGGDQGFLPKVVRIRSGSAVELPGDGAEPTVCAPVVTNHGLLLAPAQRADVIVDFSCLEDGTEILMVNRGPDAPFPAADGSRADPASTGLVMKFIIDQSLLGVGCASDRGCDDAVGAGKATPPENLVLGAEPPLAAEDATRKVSLNEGESDILCVTSDPNGVIIQAQCPANAPSPGDPQPFGPKEALLGTVSCSANQANKDVCTGKGLHWMAKDGQERLIHLRAGSCNPGERVVRVTETPTEGQVESWQIYNFTADAHPIHLHLVRFEVVGRRGIDCGDEENGLIPPQPWEKGYADTVIAYPGQITIIKAKFDRAGLYVWHCHIVEHEDNEMMRPYYVLPRSA